MWAANNGIHLQDEQDTVVQTEAQQNGGLKCELLMESGLRSKRRMNDAVFADNFIGSCVVLFFFFVIVTKDLKIVIIFLQSTDSVFNKVKVVIYDNYNNLLHGTSHHVLPQDYNFVGNMWAAIT